MASETNRLAISSVPYPAILAATVPAAWGVFGKFIVSMVVGDLMVEATLLVSSATLLLDLRLRISRPQLARFRASEPEDASGCLLFHSPWSEADWHLYDQD